jgi:hypothetical protein
MTTEAELYQEKFDPHIYFRTYYEPLFKDDAPPQTFRQFQLSQIYNFYSTLKGDAASNKCLYVLEFGGGPTIASVISAAPYAEKIIFSDFVGRNREFVDSWRSRKDVDNDFSLLIRYVVAVH